MMAGIVNSETKGGCLTKKATVYTSQERLGNAPYNGVIRSARNAITQENITTLYLPAQSTPVSFKSDGGLRKRTVHTEDIGTGYIKHVIRKEHGKAQNWEKRIDVTFTKCETPDSPLDSQSEYDAGGGCGGGGDEDRMSMRSCGACKINRRSADTPFLRRVRSASSELSRYTLTESYPPATMQRTMHMEGNSRTPQTKKKNSFSTESTRISCPNSTRKSSLGDLDVSRSRQLLLRRNNTEIDIRRTSHEDVSVAARRRRHSAHEHGQSLPPKRESDGDSVKLSTRTLNTRRESKDAVGKLSPRSTGIARPQTNSRSDQFDISEENDAGSSSAHRDTTAHQGNGSDNAPNSWTVEKCQKWMETLPEKFSGLNNILLPPIDHDSGTSSLNLPPPGGGNSSEIGVE